MKNEECKNLEPKDAGKLADEQIDQVSGGAQVDVKKPPVVSVPAAVGDMKKDPA